VQRTVAGEARWSVQLVLEGVPLQKEKNIISEGVSALDIGPASVAGYGAEDAFLSQFCDEVIHPWRAIKRDQRGLDRSRRATNPDNYNPDGSVKKGTRKWHRSNRYQKLQARIAETQRKLAATRKKQRGSTCSRDVCRPTHPQSCECWRSSRRNQHPEDQTVADLHLAAR